MTSRILTWDVLAEAIQELSPEQRKMGVTLLDEETGSFFLAERLCISGRDALLDPGIPLITADLTPWGTVDEDQVVDLTEEDTIENSFAFYEGREDMWAGGE